MTLISKFKRWFLSVYQKTTFHKLGFGRQYQIRAIVDLALTLALSYFLTVFFREFFGVVWAEGGTIAPNWLPLILYTLRYGLWYGWSCLSLYGLMVVFLAPNSVLLSVWQVIGDTFFQYWPILAVLIFRSSVIQGKRVFVAFFLIYALAFSWAFTAGFLFYGSYAPTGQSKYIYSAIYNGPIFAGSWFITALTWLRIQPQLRTYLYS